MDDKESYSPQKIGAFFRLYDAWRKAELSHTRIMIITRNRPDDERMELARRKLDEASSNYRSGVPRNVRQEFEQQPKRTQSVT